MCLAFAKIRWFSRTNCIRARSSRGPSENSTYLLQLAINSSKLGTYLFLEVSLPPRSTKTSLLSSGLYHTHVATSNAKRNIQFLFFKTAKNRTVPLFSSYKDKQSHGLIQETAKTCMKFIEWTGELAYCFDYFVCITAKVRYTMVWDCGFFKKNFQYCVSLFCL